MSMASLRNLVRLLHPDNYRTARLTTLPAILRPAIKVTRTRFAGAVHNEDGNMSIPNPTVDGQGRRFTGPPSKEIDAAWDNLLFGRYVRLSDSEVHWLNRDKTLPALSYTNLTVSDKLSPGYHAGPDMLHSLHCLNTLRKHLDYKYYNDQMKIPKGYRRMHVEHCIDQLRQAVLCHGDLTPVTLKSVRFWDEDKGEEVWALLGETERKHSCRNGAELAEKWHELGRERGYFAAS